LTTLVGALFMTATTASAAGSSCAATCTQVRKSCVRRVKTERTTMRLNCADLGGDKSCMKEAAVHTRTAMHSCRSDTTSCRSCAGTGGTSDTCSPTCDSTPLQSTWDGIQRRIFERHGCTQAACHGSAKQGGLDLSEDAYKNLVEVQSPAFSMVRVEPGDE